MKDDTRNPLIRIAQVTADNKEIEIYNRYAQTKSFYDNKDNLRTEEVKRYYYSDQTTGNTFQSTFSVKADV